MRLPHVLRLLPPARSLLPRSPLPLPQPLPHALLPRQHLRWHVPRRLRLRLRRHLRLRLRRLRRLLERPRLPRRLVRWPRRLRLRLLVELSRRGVGRRQPARTCLQCRDLCGPLDTQANVESGQEINRVLGQKNVRPCARKSRKSLPGTLRFRMRPVFPLEMVGHSTSCAALVRDESTKV